MIGMSVKAPINGQKYVYSVATPLIYIYIYRERERAILHIDLWQLVAAVS